MKNVEVLAPAGGLLQLKSAVYNGADAIYFGGERFSARKNAHNFTIEDIKEGRYITSKYGVKMYCALNTMLFDDEIEDALNYASALYSLGVDALIVQDIGLVKLLREHLPQMEIHSSTQMSIHNTYGGGFLRDMGVKRIVVPRESTEEDIKAMSTLGVELEAFVHGALCISYSGQCLMSSMIGGRSGNRGACAQPCRLNYSLEDAGKGALLSPKDLMLLEEIPRLLDAGVTSLKIEGRMKTPEYVGTVVRAYRLAVDAYLQGRDFTLDEELLKELKQVFSRDFTKGYFNGIRGKELMNPQKSNHQGTFLGRLVSYHYGKGDIKLKSDLEVGDRLVIWTKKEGRVPLEVNRILMGDQLVEQATSGDIVTLDIPQKVGREDRLFKVESAAIKRELNTLLEAHQEDMQNVLAIEVEGRVGGPLTLNIKDNLGKAVSVTSHYILEEAINHPLTEETFRKQMRLGGTNYSLGDVTFTVEGDVMVPKSVLNDLRREAIQNLEGAEPEVFHLKKPGFHPDEAIHILAEVTQKEQALAALEKEVTVIYPLIALKGQNDRWPEVLDEFLKGIKKRDRQNLILDLPRIIREKELEQVTSLIKKYKGDVGGFRAHTIDGLALLKTLDVSSLGSSSLNISNSFSYDYIKNTFKTDVLEMSSECTLEDLISMRTGGGIEVYGRKELMYLEHCVLESENVKGGCRQENQFLEDRIKARFPVKVDGLRRSHIYNSKKLMIFDEISRLYKVGYHCFSLRFVEEMPWEMAPILESYIRGIQFLASGDLLSFKEYGEQLKEQVRDYTKGHYFRGVR